MAGIHGDAENAEPGDEVLARVGRAREIGDRIAALAKRNREAQRLCPAQNVQRDDLSGRATVEADVELAAVLHRLAVSRQRRGLRP